jgi:hypothetical protein
MALASGSLGSLYSSLVQFLTAFSVSAAPAQKPMLQLPSMGAEWDGLQATPTPRWPPASHSSPNDRAPNQAE